MLNLALFASHALMVKPASLRHLAVVGCRHQHEHVKQMVAVAVAWQAVATAL
jgi:hypothetical protein